MVRPSLVTRGQVLHSQDSLYFPIIKDQITNILISPPPPPPFGHIYHTVNFCVLEHEALTFVNKTLTLFFSLNTKTAKGAKPNTQDSSIFLVHLTHPILVAYSSPHFSLENFSLAY